MGIFFCFVFFQGWKMIEFRWFTVQEGLFIFLNECTVTVICYHTAPSNIDHLEWSSWIHFILVVNYREIFSFTHRLAKEKHSRKRLNHAANVLKTTITLMLHDDCFTIFILVCFYYISLHWFYCSFYFFYLFCILSAINWCGMRGRGMQKLKLKQRNKSFILHTSSSASGGLILLKSLCIKCLF